MDIPYGILQTGTVVAHGQHQAIELDEGPLAGDRAPAIFQNDRPCRLQIGPEGQVDLLFQALFVIARDILDRMMGAETAA